MTIEELKQLIYKSERIDVEFKNQSIIKIMCNIAELQVGPQETNRETNRETSKETNKEVADKIIGILELKPEITVNKIAEILDMSAGGVRYHINKLKQSGIIEHIGSTKKESGAYINK